MTQDHRIHFVWKVIDAHQLDLTRLHERRKCCRVPERRSNDSQR